MRILPDFDLSGIMKPAIKYCQPYPAHLRGVFCLTTFQGMKLQNVTFPFPKTLVEVLNMDVFDASCIFESRMAGLHELMIALQQLGGTETYVTLTTFFGWR